MHKYTSDVQSNKFPRVKYSFYMQCVQMYTFVYILVLHYSSARIFILYLLIKVHQIYYSDCKFAFLITSITYSVSDLAKKLQEGDGS